jgi:hypothetical protein
MGTGVTFTGVKRPGRESDHSLPYSAKVKNTWNYTSTLPYAFMTLCLVKQKDNFALLYLWYPLAWRGTHVNLSAPPPPHLSVCTQIISVKSIIIIDAEGAAKYWTKLIFVRSSDLKIKIYKTVILPVVLYGCETWSLT